MAKARVVPNWPRALILLTSTVITVVVVACLYWAQAIFIPVALAIFLAFLLSPLVTFLQRRGLGRVSSVIVVVLVTALALAGTGWAVAYQVAGLVEKLPEYGDNIRAKARTLRDMTQSPFAGRLDHLVQEVVGELKARPAPEPTAEVSGQTAPGAPATVVVKAEGHGWWPVIAMTAAEVIAGGILAVVLAIFILLKREDLRNRVIRLVGRDQVTRTTKAVDEAAQRVSRFLLMQLIVNASFGLALALGLWLLGLEYALLWGFLAAVLRYIPYIGGTISIILPLGLSIAESTGWWQPLAILGLILVLELISNNFMEPYLYGRSMGVSEVALMVSAAFFAFLWGPIGLILASPLTVCLVVMGRYVRHLEFLDVLLGDLPALDTPISYYQRLLAHDQDEAQELVLTRARESAPELVYDELLVRALNYTRRDQKRGAVTAEDGAFIVEATRAALGQLSAYEQELAQAAAAQAPAAAAEPPAQPRVRVLGCPARDAVDRVGLEMLKQMLDPLRWDMEITAAEALTSELVGRVAEKKPTLICIGSVPPGGLAHTRYLCKRLRARLPDAKILVGRWGLRGHVEANEERLRGAGADEVTTTLLQTRNHLAAWQTVLATEQAKQEAEGRVPDAATLDPFEKVAEKAEGAAQVVRELAESQAATKGNGHGRL